MAVLVLSLVSTAAVAAGSRSISTFAGGGNGDNGPPAQATLSPVGLAGDGDGTLYVTDGNQVRKVTAEGTITTVAGNGTRGFSGDGGPATQARLHYPNGVTVGGGGTLYIADTFNHRVRKVTADGTITTIAGNGTFGSSGDGGPATNAALYTPSGLALDAEGNLYIADSDNHRIRRITTDGTIATVAGDGTHGFSGDGGPAVAAQLHLPHGVAVDAAGTIYIADLGNNRVRKVMKDGTIITLAGTGAVTGIEGVTVCPRLAALHLCFGQDVPVQFVGDGGPAVLASLSSPFRVTLAPDGALDGALYIADTGHHRVRMVMPDGTITTVAGNGRAGYSGDGGTATSAALRLPLDVAADSSRNVFVSDGGNLRIRTIHAGGTISTTAGNGYCCYGGDGGPAAAARLDAPTSVAFDGEGSAYIADTSNNRIRKVSPDGTIVTIAGNGISGYSGDGGPATAAEIAAPSSVAVDGNRGVFIADNYRIRKVAPDGTITTVAGNGIVGYSGDGGPATAAEIGQVFAIAVDSTGTLYLGDSTFARVRKVSPDGTITTVAGNGIFGYSGDGGPATAASIGDTLGLAVDGAGNLYISAYAATSRVRKVSLDGIITTVAGSDVEGFAGDGGPATEAALFGARGIAVDRSGVLYIADTSSQRVRRVAKSGKIRTVAGNGIDGFAGDGGPAAAAMLSYPSGVGVSADEKLFIADTGNARIRTVS